MDTPSSDPLDADLSEIEIQPVPEQLCPADLRSLIERHAEWKKGVLGQQRSFFAGRARLDGLDLTKFCFEGVDLACASLRGVCADGVDFSGANLAGADLRQGSFKEARFVLTDLRSAQTEGAVWTGADVDSAKMDEGLAQQLLRGKRKAESNPADSASDKAESAELEVAASHLTEDEPVQASSQTAQTELPSGKERTKPLPVGEDKGQPNLEPRQVLTTLSARIKSRARDGAPNS